MAELIEKQCPHCGHMIDALITGVCTWGDHDPDEPPPEPAEETSVGAAAADQPEAAVEILVAGARIRLVAEQTILLGRQGDSRVATALARFDNVSKRHATVTARGNGTVEVYDVGSTNGTFVAEQRLNANEQVAIVLPTTIRLAAYCYVELRAVDG